MTRLAVRSRKYLPSFWQSFLLCLAIISLFSISTASGATIISDCQEQIAQLITQTDGATFVGTRAAKDRSGLIGKLTEAKQKLDQRKCADATQKVTDYRSKVLDLIETGKLRLGMPPNPDLVSGADNIKACIAASNCQVSNLAPTANAGPDQTVEASSTVQLDGTASADPEGASLRFSWSFVSRPAGSGATLSDPSVAKPTFDADVAGTYLLQLVVHDGQIGSTADLVQITAGTSDLTVAIDSPPSLITVGSSPLQVTGRINPRSAVLTVNGVPVSHDGRTFAAAVTLQEGHNTVVARAVLGSEQLTDSISVSLDLTPPYITIESHQDGQTVYENAVTITGLVNDIVRGTIEAQQATVTVNGRPAVIANRSYAATGVPLVQGSNVITVRAADQVGNADSVQITLNYQPPQGQRIEVVSGQNQTATIDTVLPAALSVRVLNAALQPVVGAVVVFRVIQGSGLVAPGTANEGRAVVITTDGQGLASARFKVGSRSGAANHKVRAAVVGYENEVVFNASATGQLGNKLSVNSGNNQRGVVGQVLAGAMVTVVTDAGGNVVAGSRVRYVVTRGGGRFQNGADTIDATTDSDGRASVEYVLGDLQGLDAQRVTATLLDSAISQPCTAGFTATAFVAGDPGQTSISGVVVDNQDNPIPGVTIRVDGTTRQAVADQQGRFRIAQAPLGPVHLVADGSTAQVPGEFPDLSYNIVTIAGVDNPLAAPIYMVKLNTVNAVFAGPQDVELVLSGYPGFKLKIPRGSVVFPDGSREGYISVTPVNASRVPMTPPNGSQPQFIVTIQPTGARFDPPAPLTMPNIDTEPPGAQVEMYSYDHDLEEFVSIGLGTVSEDGSVITSNRGVGVVKAGWHANLPPNDQGCVANCAECKAADANCNCVADDSQSPQDTPGDCKNAVCSGGAVSQVPDNSDVPPVSECRICRNGVPTPMALSVTGQTLALVNQATTYTASSADGALPGSGLQWTVASGSVAGSGASVAVTFNSASSSSSDLKRVQATCGTGNSAFVDVCVVAPTAAPTGTSSVNYIENVVGPWTAAWGSMAPLAGQELTIDIAAYYDSGTNSWRPRITRADSGYRINWRLLAGVQEATVTAATAGNCATMIEDLSTLGYPSGRSAQWYKLAAVEAHERVHVTEWRTSLNPAFASARATIEQLSVPHTCGWTAPTAAAQLKSLPAYSQAINGAISAAGQIFWAIPDPNGNTDAAEHAVVDPVVSAIKALARQNNWPVACQ